MNEHLTNRNYTKKKQIFDFINEYNGKRKLNFMQYNRHTCRILAIECYKLMAIVSSGYHIALRCKINVQISIGNNWILLRCL